MRGTKKRMMYKKRKGDKRRFTRKMRGGIVNIPDENNDIYINSFENWKANRKKSLSQRFRGFFKKTPTKTDDDLEEEFLQSEEGKKTLQQIASDFVVEEQRRQQEEQRRQQEEQRRQQEEQRRQQQEQRVKQLEEELKNIERKINKMLLIRNISDFERKQMSELSERKEEIIDEINELNEVNQQNMEFTPYEEDTEADKEEELNHVLKALQENINNRPDEIIPKGGKRKRRKTKRRKH
jgi:DNA repair exonuclease SbcCD ATPase subunit